MQVANQPRSSILMRATNNNGVSENANKAQVRLAATAALTLPLTPMPAYADGMSASYLPAILTPLVGIVMPGIMMSLFFIFT